MDHYDEFGNYIGPELEDSEEEEQEELEAEEETGMEIDVPQQQIVLHEDKKYYPSAEEVYGPGVENLVEEEDAQPLTVPIIAPPKVEKTFLLEKDLPETTYNKESFL